jgi:DNA-binding winged helix-turn-helix (wHTH) protein
LTPERTLNVSFSARSAGSDEEAERQGGAVFGPFELDLATGVLTRCGERVALRPAAASALVLLVRNGGALTSRQELRQYIWGEAFVEWETGLHQCIRQVRRALGDSARSPRYVETVPRRGYRFIATVLASEGQELAAASSGPARAGRWTAFAAGLATALAVPAAIVVICALMAG